jgi:hypothetical protein
MLRHAVQLELYRVLISEWLAVNNLATYFRVSTQAGVWLLNEPWWTPIPDTDMKRSALIVKQLRSGENTNGLRSLIETMTTSPRDVQWRLERRCEACVYQGHCTSEAAGAVRALPDQSAEAQTVMQSILSELAQGSEQDIEDVCGAVKKLRRHVSLYFSEGSPLEETTIDILHLGPSSQQGDEGQRGAPPGSSGNRFIFDHVEGVREARAFVVRGHNLLAHKESVREHITAQRRRFQGRLVVGLEQWHIEDGPHPTVAFVLDSRGTELTSDAHWLKHRIQRFDEDESAGTALVEFRYAGETFRAQGVVRRRRQNSRSLREVSIERGAFQRGDTEMLRLGNDGVYRLTVAREEMLRCGDVTPAPLNLGEGREQPIDPLPSAYDYVNMIDNIPAGMATQLFRSRQKLSACATGRVLPYAVKHKAFPLFAEDVGVYFSINSDPHLGEAGSEYIFSWTALVRFHTANVERVVSHSPKSKVPPHETLIEYLHALFAQISDHNESIKSETGEDDVRQFVKLQCYVFDPSEVSRNLTVSWPSCIKFFVKSKTLTDQNVFFHRPFPFTGAVGSVAFLCLENCTADVEGESNERRPTRTRSGFLPRPIGG